MVFMSLLNAVIHRIIGHYANVVRLQHGVRTAPTWWTYAMSLQQRLIEFNQIRSTASKPSHIS
jgi:hypothetical protein